MRSVLVLVAALAVTGCSHTVVTEVIEEETSAPTAIAPETIAKVERRADGNLTAGNLVLTGRRAADLEPGRDYRLLLARTEQPGVRSVVDARKVLHLVGTLDDDGDAMRLTGVHAGTFRLTGGAVTTYRSIRDALPDHDYSRTLFAVDAVEDLHTAGRYEWLSYEPVPTFRCTHDASSLDLVSVQRSGARLDGFVATRLGREAKIGAHVACDLAHGGLYACSLDEVGRRVGEARFAPGPRFAFALPDGPELACAPIDRAEVDRTSED